MQVYNVQLSVPELQISCARQVSLGSLLRVKISFTNTLLTSLSRMLFILQAQSLCSSKELSYKYVRYIDMSGEGKMNKISIVSRCSKLKNEFTRYSK